ncbi:MAG TPA: DNA internalization-related competence protein ComEC/Rec2 [Candidatus Acidoferrales bacterium]|nr:DNA internalization-related competence protein ComEC/Rec2 [Candidatus Acidoferrales bacterium]
MRGEIEPVELVSSGELEIRVDAARIGARERIAPVYAVAFAIVVGDGLANFHLSIPFWIPLVVGIVALAAFLATRPGLGTIIAYLAIALSATAAADAVLAPPLAPGSIRNLTAGSRVTIEGRVFREVERELYGDRLYVAVERAAEQGTPMVKRDGAVRIVVPAGGGYRLGDEVRFTAPIHFPRNYGNPGEFDYAALMAREGIDATMTAAIRHAPAAASSRRKPPDSIAPQVIGHRSTFPASQIESIRLRIGQFFDRNLDYPENAEMRALVIGDRGEIGELLRNIFARTGMAHLLVISGLHLSIVAGAMFAVMRLAMMMLPGMASRGYANKVAAIGAMLAVTAYASIAGHHVSTIRALVMVLAYMLAVTIDRAREVLAALALAAIVICVAIPGSTADIGFQLSFVSVIGIVLGMERFAAWFARRKRLGRLPGEAPSRGWRAAELGCGYFAVSFWAMLATAPLTAFHFNQFAVVGLVANAVVVPIMAFGATISGLVAAALSFISPAMARPVLLFGALALRVGNWLAEAFVEWPMAWSRIFTPTILELAIVYGLLLLWLLAPLAAPVSRKAVSLEAEPNRSERIPRFGLRVGCATVLATILLIDAAYWTYDRFLNRDLRVAFLSVGEGDAAVVRFPGSGVMVIDGGSAFGGFDDGERIVAPYLWSQKIMRVDYVAMSHADLDHFGGLGFVVANFAPRAFWTNGVSSLDFAYGELFDELVRRRVPIVRVGERAPVGEIGGVSISSLNGAGGGAARTPNNSSMVLRFDLGKMSILFTGDIESGGERALLANPGGLQSTILKVPHHGSRTSSTPAFVAAVRPAVAVISDGYLNHFHFPAPAVVERYRDAGATIFRTDLDGAVMLDAARDGATIRSWRGSSELRLAAPANPATHR